MKTKEAENSDKIDTEMNKPDSTKTINVLKMKTKGA
jgi:hypothetical protein